MTLLHRCGKHHIDVFSVCDSDVIFSALAATPRQSASPQGEKYFILCKSVLNRRFKTILLLPLRIYSTCQAFLIVYMDCSTAPIALQFLHSYRRLTVLPVLVCLPCPQKIFNPEIAQSIYFACLLNTCFYSPDRVEWLCRTSTDRFILLTTVLSCAIHKLFFSSSVSVILCMD